MKNGVFRLNTPQQNVPELKVQGHIDLSSINSITRPKKKSKDERKKEREEKMQQDKANKKRQRIGKERVDVNAVINEQRNNKNK